jgi:hypothetical protein
LYLCIIKNDTNRKTSGHAGTYSHTLTSTLDGGEQSASNTSCLTTAEIIHSSHHTGGLAHPKAALETKEMKIFCPCQELNTNIPVIQLAA